MADGGVKRRLFTVRNPLGLHARPATLLARTAGRFSSSIEVRRGRQAANGKSVLNLMMLAAQAGAVLEVLADGEDSEEALDALEALFEDGFGEG